MTADPNKMKDIRNSFFAIIVFISSALSLQAQVTIDSIRSTPVTCGGGSDGTLFVYISGGTGAHNFTLFRGATFVASSGITSSTSYQFTGLIKSFLYLVIVEDGDPIVIGFDNENATVSGPVPITITSATDTDITCHDANNGTITVTAIGEGGNYIFDLAGPDPGSNETGIFTGLSGGDYTVTVSDKDGCPSTDVTPVLNINNPSSITIAIDNVVNVLCYGDNTGSIAITPDEGTPSGVGTGYTYSWTGPGGFSATTEDITGLESGDYFVTVFDANMCSANAGPINISQPTELTALLTSTTDVSCIGGNDGKAEMTPGGGVGGYSYYWEGQMVGLISTDQNPVNLVADTYDFILDDANGCSKTFNSFATIGEPDPFNINVDGTTDVSCSGFSDGSATIIPSGGTPPYTFLWSGATSGYSSAEQDPTGMPADDYDVTITDANGCSQPFPGLLTINEPAPIAVTVDGFTEVSCFGGSDGSADITVTGGTPFFTFNWIGNVTGHSSSEEDPDDLIPDTYDLTILDNNGCTLFSDNLVTIDEPADLSVTVDNITDVNCNGEFTGSVQITPAGGTPGYSYSWSGPGGFSASTKDISNLGAGDYDLTLTDSRGCSKEFISLATVNTNTPLAATFILTDISCNGGADGAIETTVSGGMPDYTYAWSGPGGFSESTKDISGLLPGTYQLTVTDDLGCTRVMAPQGLTEPTAVTASATHVDIDCYGAANGSVDLTPSGGVPPYTFNWTGPGGFSETTEDISGLGPGSYSVTVTDGNGCPTLFTGIAAILEPAEIQYTSMKTDISCSGLTDGSIDITVTGGTQPYLFSWTGPGGFSETTEDISGLGPGSYSVSVTDGNGCTMDFPDVETINEPAAVTATYVSHLDVLCNGDANGSIEIDVSGGTAPFVFDWTNSTGTTVSTDEDPAGLPAETYSVAITDANGCSVSYPGLRTITEPPLLSAALAKTDIQCHGDGNGTITVTAAGGTGPYEYSRVADLDPFYQPSNIFSGLGPNLYTIYTRDAHRCVVSDTITIEEPDEIQINGETKSGQNLCYGDSSAQINIYDVTGGVLPYEYSINGGADFYSTSLFTHLPAGNYQTVVKDASGCTASGNLNVITQPTMLRIDSYAQEDITTCYDAREGRIVIAGTGGNGKITYTLNDTLPRPLGDFKNLPGGFHKVTMKDENGCTRDTTVVILTPPQIVVDNVTVTHITGCAGDSSGEISVSGSGGTGALTYAVDGGGFQPGGTFTGLTAGNHTVTLMDGSSCTLDTVIQINEPGPIAITSELVTQITCSGAGDGVIGIMASGGTPPLSYTLNPGSVSGPGGLFSGLGPGTYTVTVDDSRGCGPVDSSPLVLSDPPEFLLDSILETDISCNGAGNGSITIYASGGVPPYEYSVDDQVTWGPDSLITGLSPDTFEVFVRDAHFCLLYGGSVIISEPPPLVLSVTVTDITTCSGDVTGAISTTGSGGAGMLEYSLDGVNFQDTGTFVSLAAGAYTIYLRDSAGCLISEPASINEPAPVTATIMKTDATFGNLGSITISGSAGGTSPYEYTIDGPGGTFSSDTSYTMLEAGTYHVMVRDANGCIYEEMIDILDVFPLAVELTVTDVTCFGANDGTITFNPLDAEGAVEYSIDSGVTFVPEAFFTGLPGNTSYYLVARDEAGKVFTGSVTIIEPEEIIIARNITAAECNAFSETGAIDITVSGGSGSFTYLWSDGSSEEDRTSLVAGTYILATTDSKNCSRVDTIVVNSLVIVDAYAGEDTTICHGASIQLSGEGGHTPSWSPVDLLSDPDIANPMAIGVTETTAFVLTITEEGSVYGCFNTDTVVISVYPLTGIVVTEDTFIIKGTSVQLEATGGPFSSYRWEPATGLDNASIPDPVASPQQSTSYTVYGTSEYGCEESDSVYIEVIENLRAYNVFSPNGDGVNDFFDIENAARFPEMIVEVYNRWGDMLFSTRGYDDASRWDGTAHGKNAPVGTYYYVIIPYSGAAPITGNVTIIR
jgi:gliding motility-associated-like protein